MSKRTERARQLTNTVNAYSQLLLTVLASYEAIRAGLSEIESEDESEDKKQG